MLSSLRGSLRTALPKSLSGLLREGEARGEGERKGRIEEGLRRAYSVEEEVEQEGLVRLVPGKSEASQKQTRPLGVAARAGPGAREDLGAQADDEAGGADKQDLGGGADRDWELVEDTPEDDYLVVGGASGGEAPAEGRGRGGSGAAEPATESPRRGQSDDDLEVIRGGTQKEVEPEPGSSPEDIATSVASLSAGEEDEEEEEEPAPASKVQQQQQQQQDDASDGSSTTTDDEPSFRCLACRIPIFKACEIISSNYHAQTSPGYLISVARNVQVSAESQTAVYTTGRYTIQDVACERCSAVLGVTYSGAADARNQYKVGKFLVGRDRLQLPAGTVHPMDKAKV